MSRRTTAALAFVGGLALLAGLLAFVRPPQPSPIGPRHSAAPSLARQASVFTVEGDGSVLVTFRLLVRDATYRNSFGFVRVDAPDGRIAELRPGMPAYVTAALRRATPVFDADLLGSGPVIGPEGNMETSAQLTLPAGSHIVLFLVQDGDLAAARDASASASADERPAVFFSVDRANPDGMHHLVILEQSGTELRRFGFEDLTGGGDEDFNDAVFEVDPGLGFADARS